jgi:hypothetical protein
VVTFFPVSVCAYTHIWQYWGLKEEMNILAL